MVGERHHGTRIVRVDRLCGDLGTSHRVAIMTVAPGQEPVTLLEYGPAYSFVSAEEADPHVSWEGNGSLRVSIGTVASLDTRETGVGGIHVRHDTGRVMWSQ